VIDVAHDGFKLLLTMETWWFCEVSS